jgi:hypothetical protein
MSIQFEINMKTRRPARRTRYWYEAPLKPEPGKRQFRQETLGHAGTRFNHFPNSDNEVEYLDEDEQVESTGKFPVDQSISLKEVNDLLRKEGIDESEVYFTAAFSDDYLSLLVIRLKELSESEKLEEYELQHAEWEKQQQHNLEYEEQRIQRELESLQRQAEELKKKKK